MAKFDQAVLRQLQTGFGIQIVEEVGMMDDKQKAGRPVGRPRKYHMPEPIDDTPENIARALMMTPPDKDWLEEEVDVEE